MIDFSRTTFNKAIKLTPDKKIEIRSKFPLKLFSEIVSVIETGSRPAGGVGTLSEGVLSLGGEHIDNHNGRLNLSNAKYVPLSFYNNATRGKLQKNDLLICKDGALTGKVAIVREELNDQQAMINEHLFLIRCENIISQFYLFEFLYSTMGQNLLKANITGSAQGGLNSTNLRNIKIPLPPLAIQRQIVSECEKIDEEYNTSRMSIEEYKKKIAQVFENLEVITRAGGGKMMIVNRLCGKINPSKSELPNFGDDILVSFVEMTSVSNDGYIEYKIDKPLSEMRKGSYTYFAEDDIIIAKITPCMENGKCAIATGLTNKIGFGSSEFHVLRCNEHVLNKYLFGYLNRETIRQMAAKRMTGASGHRRVPISFYENLEIPVPSLTEQEKIVAEVSGYEAEIAKAKAVMAGCADRKKAVLERWLG